VSLLQELENVLAAAADPERARAMAAYMRDQFAYYGVGTTERRRLTRPLLKAYAEADLRELWARPQRELQYCACEYLDLHRKRLSHPELLPTLEHLLTTKSWWDTVDALASHSVGGLVLRYPELHAAMDAWSQADNMWLRRTALIYQLSFKEKTDEERLFRNVDRMAHEKEFFIRKAIGWALRQYARVAPDRVREFLAPRRDKLSGLSLREATKHL